MSKPLPIAGLIPFSATDWPGKLTATAFLTGCPWRCSYCHNPTLQDPRGTAPIGLPDVLALLRRRVGLLDAVVFSGGEPLMHVGLAHAIRTIREEYGTAFGVGLHTGGYSPQRLATLLKVPLTRPDWIGLDVKGLPEDMPEVVGCTRAGAALAWESARLVAASGVDCQIRTTVWPGSPLEDHLPALRKRVEEELKKPLTVQWARGVDAHGSYIG